MESCFSRRSHHWIINVYKLIKIFGVIYLIGRSGKRYAISILSDDGQSRKIVRLNPTTLVPHERSAFTPPQTTPTLQNVSNHDTDDKSKVSWITTEEIYSEASDDENLLDLNQIPDVALRIIFKHFKKRELFRLMGVSNQRWRNLIYDALHCHQRLSLFIGPEKEADDCRYVVYDISCDHLTPPSIESKKRRQEFLRFDQLNRPIYEWLRPTFPQIRVFEAQVFPSFLSTNYIYSLLRSYSAQLVTVRLSIVGFKFLPYPLLVAISHMPNLRHLTLHGLSCIWENPGNAMQILGQLESFHFSLDTRPPSYRNLMESITNYGVSNTKLKEITLDIKGFQQNAEDIRDLPVIVKAKIVKLRLNLMAPGQIAPALLNCSSLRVLSLYRVGNFPVERMLTPLGQFPQLRHLKLDLNDLDITSYIMRSLLTPEVARTITPLPSITSLTITLTTISHQSLCGFPFPDIFTGVKWIRFHFCKFLCPHHPFDNAEMRKACNRLLVFPLVACPKIEKIYAFSFRYRPQPNDAHANSYLQNEVGVRYEWTTKELTAE